MNGEDQHDDHLIERLIEGLEHPTRDPLDPFSRLADDVRGREYLELLGLLPQALEPDAPSPELKARLMTRLSTPESQRELGDLTLVGTPDARQREQKVDATLHHQTSPGEAGGTAALDERLRPGPVRQAVASPRSAPERPLKRWVYALAAVLGICLVGLGVLAGRVNDTQHELISLAHENARMRDEYLRVRDRLTMVTTVARQAYPVRAAAKAPTVVAQDQLTGTIYVCGAHQQWYLSLHGLPPAPQGMHYNFWFLTKQGAVDGGTIKIDAERNAEMEAPSMPLGTRGFAVTLEAQDVPQQPQKPYLLVADQPVSL